MGADNRGLLIVLAVVLLVISFGPGLVWGMMGWSMMGPGIMGPWGAAASSWWSVAMLAFWALMLVGIAVLVIWAVRQMGPGEAAGRRPLEILKERYARGELTREHYEQMRHDLEDLPGASAMHDRRLLVGRVALSVLGIAEMALLSADLLVPRVVDTVAGRVGAAAAGSPTRVQ